MNPAALFGEDIAEDAPLEDPLELLGLWLARVGDTAADTDAGADASTTPLMALATVDAHGDPRVRHVLLSAHDAAGLHFHTDALSEKAAQLAAHPRAAATIVWPEIPRQLSVAGPVIPEAPDAAAAAFTRRSRYLQLLAWVNDAELAQLDAPARRARFAAYDAAHPRLDPPPTWSGWILVPERITFWRGGADAPSLRIGCVRAGSGWEIARLPG